MNHKKYLEQAAKIALKKLDRTYLMAALAVRKDGALISCRNGFPLEPNQLHHAEARLCRKLDTADTVFVARILRTGNIWAMARPCDVCQILLKSKRVKRVVYTIGPNEWGVLVL